MPTLVPEAPLFAWLSRLDDLLAGATQDGNVVLDLSGTKLNAPGLRALVQEIQSRGMRVAGLVGVGIEQLGEQAAQLPPVLSPEPARAKQPAPLPPPMPAPVKASVAGLLVEGNVRSGQRIDHPGDITVMGTVSSGAEIVAGGSVQIHGILRGRAMAGMGPGAAGGSAHIYCQVLQAELLMIGGVFLAADDMDPHRIGCRVMATTDGEAILLRELA
jgi:septum site-determining protein MinC